MAGMGTVKVEEDVEGGLSQYNQYTDFTNYTSGFHH
jgi:hypothetical protein